MTVRQIACFFMIFGFCSSTTLAQISARPGPPDRYASREILVFPRQPGQSPALVRKLRQQGFQVLAQAPLSGMIIAAVPAAGLELTMCQYLELWHEVLVAECNAIGESNQPVCPLGGTPNCD